MYLRLLFIIAIFDRPLAMLLAPILVGLMLLGMLMAAGWHWLGNESHAPSDAASSWPANPLELGAALIFAVSFVAVSIAASWAQGRYGAVGIYGLAAVVGITDIDPFVLSLAQHGTGQLSARVGASAIILAASSNNIAKAAYALAYAGGRVGWPPAAMLTILAGCGAVLAAVVAR
jgi:uncharacterized membrane protein (DUF4010 family)